MTFRKLNARFVMLAILTTLLVVSVGFVGAQDDEFTVSDEFAGTELRLIMANHAWNNAMQRIAPEFEEASGITLRIESYFEDQLSQRLQIGLTSGMSQADVFMFRPLQEGRLFAVNGWVADLTETAANDTEWNWGDFQGGAVSTVTLGDMVYGIPIVTEREIVYYRKDIFEEAGIDVPTTMEELRAAAEALNDPANNFYGITMRGQRAAAVTQFSSFLYSFGGDWLTEDGMSGLGSEAALEAYEFYGSLLHDFGPPGSLNIHWPQALAVFQQGNAAMFIDADSLVGNFTPDMPIFENIGFAQIPAGPAGSRPYNVTSWALGMNAATPNEGAAWEFIRWATSPDIVLRLQQMGNPGPRDSVWAMPESLGDLPQEFADVVISSGETGVGYDRPLVIRVGEARDIVGQPIVISIEGGDVAAAVADADAAFSAFLEEEAETFGSP
jgi:multiple sugar transport system substrate-binding protein